MGCGDGIAKAIVSDCSTSKGGGLEVEAYIFNRTDLTVTYDGTYGNLIEGLANVGAALGYKITGVKSLFDAGFDRVVSPDRPDKYKHYFKFQQFEFAAQDLINVDNINDVIIVVESKDKPSGSDGVFQAFGVKNGLYVSTDTKRANTINGARQLELTSLDGQEEPFSNYVVLDTDYATTKALLESLLT